MQSNHREKTRGKRAGGNPINKFIYSEKLGHIISRGTFG
ncbi:hypothetical protein NIES4072_39610 [Nostoc commune NIES-4072]|uniref:Uncharacterized protein n=1 Tax=Nostoc commune NIES-4072 TaxID=2005467 RepID=A0A2R5FXA0_NOSCO|nr:hypothetical protein NIES4070_51160 [Nostoc commune HK-02]GBG20284.1 hypothetical protein NIES4072_39610 [Nostoc commune NIES-4072]